MWNILRITLNVAVPHLYNNSLVECLKTIREFEMQNILDGQDLQDNIVVGNMPELLHNSSLHSEKHMLHYAAF